ncbi:MAG: aminotransferase class V-fold PLP-dependent enzyme, partial [Gorillibacterium sp.]|nr:aminotransferase class V-fold PLP-dependent enzyme [Gorillibacterium sp.]
ILPWQMVAQSKGAELVYLYCDEAGKISDDELEKIDELTAIVAFPYVSNGLGIVHDVAKLIDKAHQYGAIVVLDGAQAASHFKVDVQALDIDFFVFSGHKCFGPQGIGVLYGKKMLLNHMPPFMLGGDMIEYVEEQTTTFAELPKKFEAGTQNVTGALGLGLAIDFIEEIGVEQIHEHEQMLTQYCYEQLEALDFVEIYGPQSMADRGALITFNVKDIHPHDVASILDYEGVAIRAGHHCCQPLMNFLEVNASCRVSISIYNSKEDVDGFIAALKKVREVFGYVVGPNVFRNHHGAQ